MTQTELGSRECLTKTVIIARLAKEIPDGVETDKGPQLLFGEAAATACPGARGAVAIFEDRGNVVVAKLDLKGTVLGLAQQMGIDSRPGIDPVRLVSACLANGLRDVVLGMPEDQRNKAYTSGSGLRLSGHSAESVAMRGLVAQVRA
jgi:hypothetical protein